MESAGAPAEVLGLDLQKPPSLPKPNVLPHLNRSVAAFKAP